MSLSGCSRADALTQLAAMGGSAAQRASPPGDRESHLAAQLAPQYENLMHYDEIQQRWRGYWVQAEGVWGLLDPTAVHGRIRRRPRPAQARRVQLGVSAGRRDVFGLVPAYPLSRRPARRGALCQRKHAKYLQQGAAEGLIVVASNESIATNDHTSGLERRRLPVYFRKRPETERRLLEPRGDTFEGELASELPGAVNWILEMPDAAMEALLRQPRVTVGAVRASWAENLRAVNPLAGWADAYLVHDPAHPGTPVGVARRIKDPKAPDLYVDQHEKRYPHYCAYTESAKALPVGLQRFSHLLEDFLTQQVRLPQVQRKRGAGGVLMKGVRLRTETDTAAPLLGDVDCVGSASQPTSQNPAPLLADVGCVDFLTILKNGQKGVRE